VFFDRLDASAFSGRRVSGLKRKMIALAVGATLPLIAGSFLSAHTNALTDVDQALVALAEAQKPSDAELLATGIDQYNAGKYEEAQVSLQQAKTEGLSAADQQKLKDTLGKVESALNERKMARAEFEAGEKALNEDKNPAEAMRHYRAAGENKFADDATRSKANSQLAVADATLRAMEAQPQPGRATDAKGMYKEAVADYKAGRYEAARPKFAQLQAAGYKPGLFEKKPGEFLKDIDKKIAQGVASAAARQEPPPVVEPVTTRQPEPQPQPKPEMVQPQPQPKPDTVVVQPQPQPKPDTVVVQPQPQPKPDTVVVQPQPKPDTVVVQPQPQPEPQPQPQPEPPRGMTAREAYNMGVEEYNRGDYTAARVHFQLAQDAGYRPPLFKDPPSRYISRINDKTRPPAVVEQTTVVTNVEPTTRPSTAAENELATTARIEKARLEQRAYEAQQKVAQAQEAQRDNRLRDAYALYQEASRLDPTNRTAIDGMAQTELMVTGGTNRADPLNDELRRNAIRRDAIRWNFDQAIADANAAIARKEFNDAQEALDRARVAKESNPTIFSQQDLAAFDSTIANAQLRLTRAQETGRVAAEQTATTEAQRDAAERARIEAVERRRTVAVLVKTAKQLVYDGQYSQAEGVLNQILAIDPTNDYAVGVKQLVSDNARFQEQRRLREKHDREFDRQLNSAEEKKIPYTDIMVYPLNWPDISDLRDRETRAERGGGAAGGNEQAMIELRKVLPEVRFDNAALADVVDFMRDVTGADIMVNWSTLQAAGIDKKAPVSLGLRNKKGDIVLKSVLASIGGPKLGYTVEDGIVRISTDEEIKSHTITQTYDIRDLLVVAPDFDTPPDFGLATSNNSGRGRGNNRGGGRGGPGSFNNNTVSASTAYASANTAKYDSTGNGPAVTSTPGKAARTDDLVAEITNAIKRQIDPDSWIDNGGKASLTYLSGGQLIVSASAENQTRVVSLLDKLREAAAIQVSIETRFLTIQRNFMEDIGVDLDFFFNINNPTRFSPIVVQQGSFPFTATPTTPVPGSIGSTAQPGIQVQGSFLDDFQVNFLIRATQASINSTTLTAPRVTVFNGQQAFVLVAQQQAYVSDLEAVTGDGVGLFNPIIDTVQTGVRLVVQPTVSADRKYVTLSLQPQVSQLVALSNFPVFGLANQNNQGGGGGGNNQQVFQASVQLPILDITSVNTIVSVPDGGTLLLGGQTLAGETEVEEGVPILSKIPFIKRLFTNRSTAKDERILLILVKPTIIIQREVEQQQFPLLGTRNRP
jgi:general secretion pathway protein D